MHYCKNSIAQKADLLNKAISQVPAVLFLPPLSSSLLSDFEYHRTWYIELKSFSNVKFSVHSASELNTQTHHGLRKSIPIYIHCQLITILPIQCWSTPSNAGLDHTLTAVCTAYTFIMVFCITQKSSVLSCTLFYLSAFDLNLMFKIDQSRVNI